MRVRRAVSSIGDVTDAYLVFFSRDPVDDALADAILERVRSCPGAGWFDDPGAPTPAERTAGGYVRVGDPDEPRGRSLLAVARSLSADHAIVVEVQWREEILGVVEAGTWRPSSSTSTRTT